MKKSNNKIATMILSFVILFTMVLGITATATSVQAASKKPTSRDKALAKAYVSVLETLDLSYLDNYKYPGLTLTSDSEYTLKEMGVDAKVICPKFSKVYNKQLNSYVIYVDCAYVVCSKTTGKAQISVMKCGAILKNKNGKAYYYGEDIAKPIKEVTKWSKLTSDQQSKIKAFLEKKLGKKVTTDLLTESYGYSAKKSSSNKTSSAKSSTAKVSGNKGTVKSPIKKGTAYKMSGTINFLDDELKGTYYMTVNSAKVLSKKQLNDLGYAKPELDKFDYVLVNVTEEVENGKMIQKKGDGTLRPVTFSYAIFDLWGSVDKNDSQSVIGGDTYSFDSCIEKQITAKEGLDKIECGKKVNYKVKGDILVPVPKGTGKKGYMIIRNPFIEDYESSKIHFALK